MGRLYQLLQKAKENGNSCLPEETYNELLKIINSALFGKIGKELLAWDNNVKKNIQDDSILKFIEKVESKSDKEEAVFLKKIAIGKFYDELRKYYASKKCKPSKDPVGIVAKRESNPAIKEPDMFLDFFNGIISQSLKGEIHIGTTVITEQEIDSLILFKLNRLSYTEIAEKKNISSSEVKKDVERCCSKLREIKRYFD